MALPDRDSPPVVHAREVDLPDPPAAPTAHPRAGRNLPLATGVALLLAGLFIVTLLTWRPLFVGFVAILVVVATLELRSALRQQEIRLPYEPLLVGGPAMVLAAYARGPLGLCVAFALTVIGVQVWRLLGGQEGYVRDMSAGLFVASYLPFLAGFAALLAVGPYGPEQVVLLVALVVCCDTGGYVAGVTMGKHPMVPRISPKKSWEGFAGSVTATVVAGALLLPWLLDQQWWEGALVGLCVTVVAVAGDLVESMVKRDLGVKDMGTLLPGHGGLMDRFDSLLPSAAVVWLLLLIVT